MQWKNILLENRIEKFKRGQTEYLYFNNDYQVNVKGENKKIPYLTVEKLNDKNLINENTNNKQAIFNIRSQISQNINNIVNLLSERLKINVNSNIRNTKTSPKNKPQIVKKILSKAEIAKRYNITGLLRN